MMEEKLPKGWTITKLREVLSVKNGYAFKSKDFKEYGIPVIRISNIQDGQVLTHNSARVPEEFFNENFVVERGDILVAMSGATTGKYGIYDGTEIALQNQRVGNLKPNTDKVSKKFIYYLLGNLKKEIEDVAYGAAQPNISAKMIEDLEFFLPPLPEQQRIVAKLDTLFGHLDSIELRLESIKNLKKQLVDAFLVDTKTGRYYTTSMLKEYIEEGTERIGKNWQNKFKVGVSAKQGVINLETGQKSSFEKYKIVRPGDFVYNAMRVNIGSIAQYQGEEIGITSPDYIVFRIKHTLSPKLLLNWLKSENGILQINSNTKGSVRSRLYFKNLANISYPIAPKTNQLEAEKILNWYHNLEIHQAEKLIQQLIDLKQAILAKAFRGELVEQEVKGYEVDEREGLMAAEPDQKNL